MEEGLLVARFQKNASEEVRAQIIKYKGHDLIDVRVWVPRQDRPGENPTKKGLTLNIELLPQLKDAVLKLETALRDIGKIA